MFVFYTNNTGDDGVFHACRNNQTILSVNLILCVIVSVVSVLPRVQVRSEMIAFCQLSTLKASMTSRSG
ncbi:MAG: serine incorporator domain-containing protein, partial [Myxococcota bacterium]